MGLWAKMASARVSTGEIVFFRCLLPAICLLPALCRVPARIWRSQWGLLVARGLFGSVAMQLYFLSIARIPYPDASMLSNTSPLFAALFAALFLGEPVSRRLRLVLPVAVVGVVFISKPSVFFGAGSGDTVGYLAALVSGMFSGASHTTVRKLTRECTPELVVGVFSWITTVTAWPLMMGHYQTPGAGDAVLLLGIGASAMAAQILMTMGYARLPTGLASTILLCSVVFAAVLSIVVLHDAMDAWQVSGMALVLGSVAWLTWERAES